MGNPDLKPETSHQADLGLLGQSQAFDYSAVVFSNQVTDYIYRDVKAGKSTYRNIKAALYGLNTALSWQCLHFHSDKSLKF